jgi:hypothetical protein
MATSAAGTLEEYLAEPPPDRREAVAAVRAMIQKHLPQGYLGTSCVRFKRAEDLPLEAIGKLIPAVTPTMLIAHSKRLGR